MSLLEGLIIWREKAPDQTTTQTSMY